jgi:hypothetical protein
MIRGLQVSSCTPAHDGVIYEWYDPQFGKPGNSWVQLHNVIMPKDWCPHPTSLCEVGPICTIQGVGWGLSAAAAACQHVLSPRAWAWHADMSACRGRCGVTMTHTLLRALQLLTPPCMYMSCAVYDRRQATDGGDPDGPVVARCAM